MRLIFRDVLSTGELIAMHFISVAIFASLQELGNFIIAHREADASLTNFAVLMAKPVERRPVEPVAIGAVTTVRFAYVTFRHKGALMMRCAMRRSRPRWGRPLPSWGRPAQASRHW